MAQRITYRRQCSYNTRSNKIRKIKTPGGRVIAQHVAKKSNLSKKLGGIKTYRSGELARLSRRQKTVSRAYGGVLSASEVKERILRAFLIEEVKIVKKIVQQSAVKKDTKQKGGKSKKN
jgi:large subunit ribosomal protein L34e